MLNGIIYSHIKVGSYNGDQFIEYLDGLLTIMNSYPGPNSVLVLDNCQIHHVAGVEERLVLPRLGEPPQAGGQLNNTTTTL
jgi:hypothetical protein